MKISKYQLFRVLFLMATMLGALAFSLCDYLLPLRLWTHPALNFLFVIFLGFGVSSLIRALIKKAPIFFFLTALFFAPSLFYILIQYLAWWICIICVVVLCSIIATLSYIVCGNVTESVALNEKADYKNYKQRKEDQTKLEK